MSVSVTERIRPAPFASESIEPFSARIIGLAASRYTQLKERQKLTGEKPCRMDMTDALMGLWWAVKGLDKIAISLRGGRDCADTSGIHFSMACTNEMRRIARIIRAELNICPFTEPHWK